MSTAAATKEKPFKTPRRKRSAECDKGVMAINSINSSHHSSSPVPPATMVVKKLPVIGPPVLFSEVQLKVAFSMLDANQDGKVNGDELRDMLSRLGFKDVISDHLITSLINDATRNGDSLISESQFLEWMPKLGLTGADVIENLDGKSTATPPKSPLLKPEDDDAEKDLRAAFAVFDQDHNGFITREELKSAMHLMNENVTEEDVDHLLAETDTDKDGQINYEEFIRMLM